MIHTRRSSRAIVALPRATLRPGSHVRTVTNRNDLVGRYPWIDGVKTGHTLDAGYVLVASGHRGGMTLISAVLGTDCEAARDANTLALLDYGFANFRVCDAGAHGPAHGPAHGQGAAGLHPTVDRGRRRTRASCRARRRVRVQRRGPASAGRPAAGAAVVGTADGRPTAAASLARIPLRAHAARCPR